jgi:hypothetical protein
MSEFMTAVRNQHTKQGIRGKMAWVSQEIRPGLDMQESKEEMMRQD